VLLIAVNSSDAERQLSAEQAIRIVGGSGIGAEDAFVGAGFTNRFRVPTQEEASAD
jgi:hypothetical protein